MIIYFFFLVKEEVSLELPEENLDYEEAEDRPEDKPEDKSEATAEEDQKKDEITAEVKSEDSKKSSTDEKSRKDSSDQTKSKSARVSIGKFTKGMVNSRLLILTVASCQAILKLKLSIFLLKKAQLLNFRLTITSNLNRCS